MSDSSVEETISPLPHELSTTDKSDFINIKSSFVCEYDKDESKDVDTNDDVGSVRASNPIPSTCQSYYFEMKVLNRGEKGYIGIGLTPSVSDLTNMPGWLENTIGYHGDDGKLLYEECSQRGTASRYGPKFGTNDVVGCGVDMKKRTVFFTINGKYLGTAVSNLPDKTWYPTVGLHSKNEMVEINFGQDPEINVISR